MLPKDTMATVRDQTIDRPISGKLPEWLDDLECEIPGNAFDFYEPNISICTSYEPKTLASFYSWISMG